LDNRLQEQIVVSQPEKRGLFLVSRITNKSSYSLGRLAATYYDAAGVNLEGNSMLLGDAGPGETGEFTFQYSDGSPESADRVAKIIIHPYNERPMDPRPQ
jgi:hypothetical protein